MTLYLSHSLLAAVVMMSVAAASGCALSDRMALRLDRHEARLQMREDRQELRHELRRLEAEERTIAAEQSVAAQRAKIAEARQCLPETAPLLESTLALPLQQQFVVSAPEVDMAELRERMKLEEQDLEQRMSEWRQAMSAWRERARLHEKRDLERRDLARRNLNQQKTHCGCQAALAAGHCCCAEQHKGKCGCDKAIKCGRCCCQPCEEVTCEYAELKPQPFTEQPPKMPLQSLPLSELPIKVRLQMRHEIGRAEITELSTRHAPLEQAPPRSQLHQPCDGKDQCAEKPSCDHASIYGGARDRGLVEAPPVPEPDDEPRTSQLPKQPTPRAIQSHPATIHGTQMPFPGEFPATLPSAPPTRPGMTTGPSNPSSIPSFDLNPRGVAVVAG